MAMEGKTCTNQITTCVYPRRRMVKTIAEIADDLSIQMTELSGDWIVQLKRDDKVRSIVGYNFPLNSASAYLLCTDKAAASDVLDLHGVTRVDHQIVWNPSNPFCVTKGAYGAASVYASRFSYQVVAKPKQGTSGEGVVSVNSARELEATMQDMFAKWPDLVICPFYEIHAEFRAVVLDGKVELLYRKVRPSVTGDGSTPLSELVSNYLNALPARTSADLSRAMDWKRLCKFESKSGSGRGMQSIPAKGERVILTWKHNLGTGSRASVDIDPEIQTELRELALSAARALGVRFASIDIIDCNLPAYSGENEGSSNVSAEGSKRCLRVLEANSGVMMEALVSQHPDLADHCRDILKRVILKMFET
eukprot:51897_1